MSAVPDLKYTHFHEKRACPHGHLPPLRLPLRLGIFALVILHFSMLADRQAGPGGGWWHDPDSWKPGQNGLTRLFFDV